MAEDESPLLSAAASGNLDEIQQLIEGGAAIQEVDSDGMTALHIAVNLNHIDVVKYLLAQGANTNVSDYYEGRSPLQLATHNNDLDMVRLLTESGANLYSTNTYDNMPIHCAAQLGYLEMIKYFLEKGMNVDVTTAIKMTPLHIAALGGYKYVVEYLLSQKANVHLRDINNRCPIHHAALSGEVEIVSALIEKGVDINVTDRFKWTPLHYAARDGYLDTVKLLLDDGAVFNLKEKSRNYSPIHMATEMNNLEIVEYFLSQGVDVDFSTVQGYTLLNVACRWGHAEMVKYLLENGADINRKILPKGATPLYFALRYCCSELAELLILSRADLKQSEYRSNSTLSIALTGVSEEYAESDQMEYYTNAKVVIKYTLLIYNSAENLIPNGCPFFTELTNFCTECQKEIITMKNVMIQNSTVSLHQLIWDSFKGNTFVQYLFNDDIKAELENIEDYLKDLSIYGNIGTLIQLNIQKGFERLKLLNDADLAMKKFTPKFPSEIRWKVFDYLDMTDLEAVIQSDIFK